jgi:hypothetical protein
MCIRPIILSALLVAGGLFSTGSALGFTAGTDPSLAGWWRLDEGSDNLANDSSGNGNLGVIQGTPTWVPGILDGALQFNGTDCYVNCGNGPSLQMQNQITMAFWIKTPGFTRNWAAIITKGDASWRMSRSSETGNSVHMGIGGTTTVGNPWFDASKPIADNAWHHIAGVYDGTTARIYIDGVESASREATGQLATNSNNVLIGENEGGTGRLLSGTLDDVRIYSRGLAAEEILTVMKGYKGPIAGAPVPADKAVDVARDVILTWTPGPYARTHDVYFGTSFDDVNAASRTSARGVLASQDQTSASFDPDGLLAFGQTYYWRVDEVNAAPDGTIYPGPVWSFTAEPYAYPVTPAKVTASSSSTSTMGPEKTIDGSGLNALDQHSTASSAMWLSKTTPSPAWIKYEFEKPCKLYQMWVWNSNQSVEPYMGYGAKEVAVEVSLDDAAWVPVEGIGQFARASGKPDYAHNTTVDLHGAMARYLRLTVKKTWGGGSQAGLSEVRFFSIPLQAFGPQPANGATGVGLDATLSWRSGRLAVRHDLYISGNSQAVSDGTGAAKGMTENRYSLSSLTPEYGRTYSWKVNEVNDSASWAGEVWSFTTVGYGVVDDFESYDDTCQRIFFSWMDGYGHSGSMTCNVAPSSGNATGSTVGNVVLPFAEQTIVHSGRQSMPLGFDNTRSPYYSEATRQWDTPQSWTRGGANALTVYVQGIAAGFLETSAGKFIMNGMGTDIWGGVDQFRFSCKLLKGNGSIVARVDAVANTHVSAKAGVMIRENLEMTSPYAMVDVTPGSGIGFERRTEAAANSVATTQTGLGAPYWIKLTRTGNTFTAQRSSDGVIWTSITADASASSVTIPMPTDAYIGLAVTSHAANRVCGARFSGVSTAGGVSGAWQTVEVGTAQAAGNSPEPFYVVVEDAYGRAKVVTHPDPTVIATGQWEEWTIPLSEFTSAGVNLANIKKVMLGVGNRNSPSLGGTGRLYIDDIRLPRVEK